MNYPIKVALVALALVAGSSLAATLPATAADVTVSTSPGGIAFGYSDGYWNRDHQWNAWSNPQQATQYQTQNRDHYYDWKHDRDSDMGWRGNDQWWNDHK